MEVFSLSKLPGYEVGQMISIVGRIGVYAGTEHSQLGSGSCDCGELSCAYVIAYDRSNGVIVRKAFLKPTKALSKSKIVTTSIGPNSNGFKKIYEKYDELLRKGYQKYCVDSLLTEGIEKPN